jgi:hypothetical protein
VLCFNGRSLCYSPRCFTRSLISNGINSSLGSPVKCITEIFNFKISWLFNFGIGWLLKPDRWIGFKFCHSWELIVAKSEWILACIDFIDFSIFLFVKWESEFVFFFCCKSKPEFLNVLNKVLLKKRKWILPMLASVVFISNNCEGSAN